MLMQQEPEQEQLPFLDMSPRERLDFLIYKADFEPSEFGAALTAAGWGAVVFWPSLVLWWQGQPLLHRYSALFGAIFLVVGCLQLFAWWRLSGPRGLYIRAALALLMFFLWFLVWLRLFGGTNTIMYFFPTYTCGWAFYRLFFRQRAAALVEGHGE